MAPRHQDVVSPALPSVPAPVETTGVAGDVLVRTVPFGAYPRYTLSEIPGPDQVRFTCLADAARLARDYACQRGVDVWADDGARGVARLSRFRQSSPPSGRPYDKAPAPAAPYVAPTGADAAWLDVTNWAPGA